MAERICFRRCLDSSLDLWGLKSLLYSSPLEARSDCCSLSRVWNELRKNSAVRRTAVRSFVVGTSTPICSRASRHLSASCTDQTGGGGAHQSRQQELAPPLPADAPSHRPRRRA